MQMKDNYFDYIIHGGDYNPDQWMKTKEVWDEDIRLMKLCHVNSATVGIFSWTALEPSEGVYDFAWLDEILDKLAANGISVILATPSGARPAWLSQKYPEVLRVNENGTRNEYGVRHNHCLTSPIYREKVRSINTLLAQRYKNHPAVKMWHISNEYSGECHCELCQEAFRQWVKDRYHGDIDLLNEKWWNGFWSHNLNDFSQINSPKSRGENHVSALKLCWRRFVTEQHISFFENEIAPLRELCPDIPITTNFMKLYTELDYQKFAKHLDIVSWDNYPEWDIKDNFDVSVSTAFSHDIFRSMNGGKPFFMMESTPSVVNWRAVNKIPSPHTQQLGAIQAVAFGGDSVQYFQWRKARGGHEKYHGAVVDHCGHENTRVFREITDTGIALEKLSEVVGKKCVSRVAIICDWENEWATEFYHGYNNKRRGYFDECEKWYRPLYERGISTDVIPMDADFSGYDLVIAPYLYMLKDSTEQRIRDYVSNGGNFVATYLFACVDEDDLCFLGGFPANSLKEVFGVWAEETDALEEGKPGKCEYNGKEYSVDCVCDIIHACGARILGEYRSDFYAGEPCLTENSYNNGKAYYAAFNNDGDFCDDFIGELLSKIGIEPDDGICVPKGLVLRKRGSTVFLLNFTDTEKTVSLPDSYTDVISGKAVSGNVTVGKRDYLVLTRQQ